MDEQNNRYRFYILKICLIYFYRIYIEIYDCFGICCVNYKIEEDKCVLIIKRQDLEEYYYNGCLIIK